MPTIAEQWFQEGYEEGFKIGFVEGKLVGEIQSYQHTLGHAISLPDDLYKFPIDQIRRIAVSLNQAIAADSAR